VLIATFFQSFVVIYFVHWIFHKSDLSFDAVVKFFTAGFVIATPTAFLIEGILVNIMLGFVYVLYSGFELFGGEDFDQWVSNNNRTLWIISELINAFLFSALTEELCKYYTFRCIEHPDLIFLTGLDREAQAVSAKDGGGEKYAYSSHNVSDFNRQSPAHGRVSEHRGGSKSFEDGDSPQEGVIHRVDTTEEFFEDDTDVRTHRERAAAVTTAMISVAVGYACAENFIYVFIFGDSSAEGQGDDLERDDSHLIEEWIILFVRSIFPVHALAAAMQSINVIRKFIENPEKNGHNIGVGRIVLPALILHGSFDAILMVVNVYVETAWEDYLRRHGGSIPDDDEVLEWDEPYDPLAVNLAAWVGIIIVMLCGIILYVRENRLQRNRLVVLEQWTRANMELPHVGTDGSLPTAETSEIPRTIPTPSFTRDVSVL